MYPIKMYCKIEVEINMFICSVMSNFCNYMDCSLPGSSVHGVSSGKNTGVGCHSLLQGIFSTQRSNPGLPHCRRIFFFFLNHQRHQGSLRILEWVAYTFSMGSSWPRNQTKVSCIARRFFTSWATREAQNAFWILSKAFSPYIEIIMWFLSFYLLIWCITFIDVHILKNLCILGINCTWSRCMFPLTCWVWIASIFLRIFTSMFISDIGL